LVTFFVWWGHWKGGLEVYVPSKKILTLLETTLLSGCVFSFQWYVGEQIVSAVHVLLAGFVGERQAG
jgi:hypothetical protein